MKHTVFVQKTMQLEKRKEEKWRNKKYFSCDHFRDQSPKIAATQFQKNKSQVQYKFHFLKI